MRFTDKYFILNEKEMPSPLRKVGRSHPLRFPVTLEKFFTTERTEMIEEKSDIMVLSQLGIVNTRCLVNQIVYLIQDMLVWYKVRLNNRKDNGNVFKGYEERDFFPFLITDDALDITVTVRFYEKKEGEEYEEKERRETLNVKNLFLDLEH